jgi:CxxC motif-containing protein (DUF1111 family)
MWLWLSTGILLSVFAAYVGRYGRMTFYNASVGALEATQSIAAPGAGDFSRAAGVASGLGPSFNEATCSACHRMPSIGGAGFRTVLKVGHRDADGTFRGYATGTLLPTKSIQDGRCLPELPPDANVIARRIPTPLYGLGLVDRIPDAEIEARADPDDRDRDGVRGRIAYVRDPVSGKRRVGRFGWKAEDASLLVSVARAYAREAGVTNRFFITESAVGLSPEAVRQCDAYTDPEDVPDPGTGLAAIDRLTAFIDKLELPTSGATAATESHGGRLFKTIGCAACHHPAYRTSSGLPVNAFSDFLLHDIGTGDGMAEGGAQPSEMRTAPLWGVGRRPLLLHDGSATQLEDAIDVHKREAARARAAFAALSAADRAALLAFLKSI